MPRHTVDSVAIRPIDLAILDGIETVSGGEGPWVELTAQKPGLLLSGRNPVCTDAIATAVMGYDPLAKSATGPFPGDNHPKQLIQCRRQRARKVPQVPCQPPGRDLSGPVAVLPGAGNPPPLGARLLGARTLSTGRLTRQAPRHMLRKT